MLRRSVGKGGYWTVYRDWRVAARPSAVARRSPRHSGRSPGCRRAATSTDIAWRTISAARSSDLRGNDRPGLHSPPCAAAWRGRDGAASTRCSPKSEAASNSPLAASISRSRCSRRTRSSRTEAATSTCPRWARTSWARRRDCRAQSRSRRSSGMSLVKVQAAMRRRARASRRARAARAARQRRRARRMRPASVRTAVAPAAPRA
jgi:hypothetical protein